MSSPLPPVAGRRRSVLVVDDHPDMRFLLANIVDRIGYRAFEAVDGDEALAMVERLRPDLLLLDMRMPGMNGLEVCRRLRAADETRLLPIVMMSASVEPDAPERALAAGANEYLAKPFPIEELIARLQAWLGNP